MPEKISIVKETGETISSNIMSVFMIPETSKQYIITTENAVDPHGLTVLHVSEIDNDNLVKVRTDDEWASIKTIMRAIISASVGSYIYIPVINTANVAGQYSRDISVSAGAAKQLLDSYTNGKKEVPPVKEEISTVSSNAIESDSIFPTAPSENDQDNEIVPGIEEVDTSTNVEPVIEQPNLDVASVDVVPDVPVNAVDNSLDTVAQAVATQVATENANQIDIPIIDENAQVAPEVAAGDAVPSQPVVDSPIVSEVIAANTEPVVTAPPIPTEEENPDDNGTDGDVSGGVVATMPIEDASVSDVSEIPGVVPVPGVVPAVSPTVLPVSDGIVPETPIDTALGTPNLEVGEVADSSLVPDIPVAEDANVPAIDSVVPVAEASDLTVQEPISNEEVANTQVVAPTVNIDTDSITSTLSASVNENLKTTITEEIDKLLPSSVENSVQPAIQNAVQPAIENTVQPAIESALNSVIEDKIKNPIEQKIEEVMTRVVEDKVQGPLMESVTKTVNDTIEKQSKALNSLGIKLDFGVESSFGKNASLDEIVAGSQELFVEGVKNLIMVMTERVYKELRVKEEELKRREIIVSQREQAVNDKTMAMLNGTYDPNAYASATPSVIPTTATAVPPASVVPAVPDVAAPVTPAVPAADVAPVVPEVPAPTETVPVVPDVPAATEPVPAPTEPVPAVPVPEAPASSAEESTAPGDAPAINLDIVTASDAAPTQ